MRNDSIFDDDDDDDNEYVFYTVNPDIISTVVNTKLYTKQNTSYLILNYIKDILCFDDSFNAIYRSVVCSFPEKKILGFSPPKSIKYDHFMEKYPEIDESIIVNEIVEGVMMNLFYDDRIQSWQISTKKSIGGNYCYKSPNQLENSNSNSKTFIQMFLEALKCPSKKCQLNDNIIIETLPKQYSYSFVLQHPNNKIILSIKEPKLYLVGVYEFSGNRVIEIPSNIYEEWDIFLNISGIIHFPEKLDETRYDDLIENYCSKYTRNIKPGIMLKNSKTGDRSKIINHVYYKRKKNRIYNPNTQYQFLCINHIGKIEDFLKYFPVCKKQFRIFKIEYAEFINEIHRCYMLKYIEKSFPDISPKYLIHVEKIHNEIYLPSLHSNMKMKIDKYVVKKYVENIEPGDLLFYLNYDNRQYLMNS